MSRENVELARAAFAAWNAGDMDAFRDAYHPEATMRAPPGWPEPGPFVGRDAIMRQFEQLRATYDAEQAEPISDFEAVADHVVVRYVWRASGTGPVTNLETTVVYTMRANAIVAVEYFWDDAEARESAGLTT
ncbi:MAG TPA: nuclear transport factor 2 family protein [Solirubrobacterales bacterium]|nr:nuclear transport factor 2 family protein [Solirubrobacterales bacterium]